MPIFAYQSLNSNASSSHGVSASNSQPFTVKTHNRIAQNCDKWMLSMPTADGVAPHLPVQGPAELVSSADIGTMDRVEKQGKKVPNVDDDRFLRMVEGKARQTHQHIYREFQGTCDALVYGELDGADSEWGSLQQNAGELFAASSAKRACNCFSIHTHNANSVTFLGEGEGWIAIKSYGVIAVFVHVPNKYASDENLAASFYDRIKNSLLQVQGGGVIDVVMGDTNQPRNGFTERVLKAVLGQNFADAHPDTNIVPLDSYKRSFGGTNSTAEKKYDIAVYNTETVFLNQMVYLSQCAPEGREAVAVTDHMGVAIEVKKLPFA